VCWINETVIVYENKYYEVIIRLQDLFVYLIKLTKEKEATH